MEITVTVECLYSSSTHEEVKGWKLFTVPVSLAEEDINFPSLSLLKVTEGRYFTDW
jgi:hypothetical protein